MQVAHASDWKNARIEVRGRGGKWDQKAKGIYRMLEVLKPGVGAFKLIFVWCSAEDVESIEHGLRCSRHVMQG